MMFQKKIPTILGLFLVLLVVGFVVAFTEGAVRAPSRASQSQQPNEVWFSNVTDVSFTVSWSTSAPTTGAILVSTKDITNRLHYDERDALKNLSKYTSHSVTVRNAKPNTDYSIKILSNGRQYSDQKNPYQIRTPSSLPINSNTLEPAYGTIRTVNGAPADGALVYLTFEGGQRMSAMTKSSGLWLIPLANVRTEDLSGFLSPSDRLTETIIVRTGEGQINATSDPLNDSPVPDMIIGQTYDFRGQQVNKKSGKELAIHVTPPTVGGTVLSATTAKKYTLSLNTPKEGVSLPTTLPLISGTGIPNNFIGISLGITTPQSGSVKVKADGTWNFTPAKHLAPGKQSVTITSVNEKGKTVAITHAFVILKSGTQVLGDATPSATLTTTLTLTPSPTETASETATPTPTTESTLSGEPVPETGNDLPTIILLILGLGLLASGIVAVKL